MCVLWQVLVRMLRRLGFSEAQVQVVDNGQLALQAVSSRAAAAGGVERAGTSQPPQRSAWLLFMDCLMPVMVSPAPQPAGPPLLRPPLTLPPLRL